MTGESQYKLYEKAIARIYSTDESVVGAGFLLFGRYILTCAHVVADALRIEHTTEKKPDEWIELDFPYPPAEEKKKFRARVVFWQPRSLEKSQYRKDIAGLELEEELPTNYCPVEVALDEEFKNHPFDVIGFPPQRDDGVGTEGKLMIRNASGLVQMVIPQQSHFYIEPGFSGAPVWDAHLKKIAGIIVTSELDSDGQPFSGVRSQVKVAYMIPVKVLIECWDDLKCQITQPNPSLIDAAQPCAPQEVANLLRELNYDRQKADFKKLMTELKPGAAFLVRAKDIEIQRWLVSLLARTIPDFENSERISINVARYRYRFNQNLWQQFGRKFSAANSRETVIQYLAELCQQKSVIIAVYDFSKLGEQMSQLHEFWCDLLKAVEQLPNRKIKSRLILFLTDEATEGDSSGITPFQIFKPNKPQDYRALILLEPLSQLTRNDVEGWLVSDSVSKLLGEDTVDEIVRQCLPEWKEEPRKMLNEICTVFDFDGIAAIEDYWKLAG